MFLARSLRPSLAAFGPGWDAFDDRWYQPQLGLTQTAAGIAIGPQTIFNCGVVKAAINFKAESVALCTPQVFRRTGDGGRTAAATHPVQALLRRPNARQTGYEWTRLMETWLCVWGNAYDRIKPGSRYFAGELHPILPDPDVMRPHELMADGSLTYRYQPPGIGVEPEILRADEVLHYQDLSLDGIKGMATYQLIRNVVAVALAIEEACGQLMRHGLRISGVLKTEQKVEPALRDAISKSWEGAWGGTKSAGKTAVLGSGFEFQPISINNRDAQSIELYDRMVQAILMALGVPGVVVGYQGDKASTYASAEAFFAAASRTCIGTAITNMEQREDASLLLDGDDHYIKRNLGVLERANTPERYAALSVACGGPFLTRNEVRDIEDRNRLDDPGYDQLLRPNNGTPEGAGTGIDGGGGQPPAGQRRLPPVPEPDEDEAKATATPPALTAGDRARLDRFTSLSWAARELAESAARALVAAEVAAIAGRRGGTRPERGAAARFADDPAGWAGWLTDFYAAHAPKVAARMAISDEAARAYCADQRGAVLARGAGVVETWEATVPAQLVALKLGE